MDGVLLPQVLEADPGNVKALYRRAQGHLAQQDYVEAELDIRAALLASHPSTDHRRRSLLGSWLRLVRW